MSTFALTAAIAMPAGAFADTLLSASVPQPNGAAVVQQMYPANVAVKSEKTADQIDHAKQAADTRQTLLRLQDQMRQLGATQ